MKRIRPNCFALGALATVLAGCAATQAGERVSADTALSAEPFRPNIILVIVDDQGWGSTSVQMEDGNPLSRSDFMQTPNLERLAARGIRFSRGYAAHPNCSPTRYGLLTGKSPAKLQATDISRRFPGNDRYYQGNMLNPPTGEMVFREEEVSIAELIEANHPEYTYAHFGKWHIGDRGPEGAGFDAGDGPTQNAEGNAAIEDDPKLTFSLTERSIAWMEDQVAAGEPFYLQVSHYSVHTKTETLRETLAKYRALPMPERHNMPSYAAMSEDLDTGLGLLLDAVERLGIKDNTYVIYISDNGGYNYPMAANINGNLHGWKETIWEGGVRIPFIIAGPDVPVGQRDAMAVTTDIFPTIADWLGIETLPKGVEGGSLVPVLMDASLAGVERPVEHVVIHKPHYAWIKSAVPNSAIYDGDYKLIHFYEDGESLLFNLRLDPEETRDLSDDLPSVAATMETALFDYLESVDAGMPTPNPGFDPANDPAALYRPDMVRLRTEAYFINVHSTNRPFPVENLPEEVNVDDNPLVRDAQ